MTSTGNDIVALKAINVARTKEFKFYSKIIAAIEKDIFDKQDHGDLAFETFVWLLWSIKESAYKYLQRRMPELVFSPTKTLVQRIQFSASSLVQEFEGTGFEGKPVYKGTVSFGSDLLFFRSMISGEFIFSVVNGEDDFENTSWGIRLIDSADPADQSKQVRAFLIARLNKQLPGTNLQISKSPDGVPILLNGVEEIDIPISLAHHDHYVAYSFKVYGEGKPY